MAKEMMKNSLRREKVKWAGRKGSRKLAREIKLSHLSKRRQAALSKGAFSTAAAQTTLELTAK